MVSRKLTRDWENQEKAVWPGYSMKPNPVVSRQHQKWSMSMVYYHWGLGCPILPVLEPRPVDWGGGTIGYWYHDRNQETAARDAVLTLLQ